MTKIQIGVAVAAIGLGILAQIPEHNHDEMDGHHHDAMEAETGSLTASPQPVAEGLETALLNVTGMT